MSKSILGRKFNKNKEKAIKIRIKAEQFEDKVVIEFMKLVKTDYLDAIENVINKSGVSKHVEIIKAFRESYSQENIKMKDITAFQRLEEIYHRDIERENFSGN